MDGKVSLVIGCYISSVPLPLLLSTGLLPMIHVAATVVGSKAEGDLLKLKLFLECQRNNNL